MLRLYWLKRICLTKFLCCINQRFLPSIVKSVCPCSSMDILVEINHSPLSVWSMQPQNNRRVTSVAAVTISSCSNRGVFMVNVTSTDFWLPQNKSRTTTLMKLMHRQVMTESHTGKSIGLNNHGESNSVPNLDLHISCGASFKQRLLVSV